nr:hypothetical protein [Tanacetum cinerariifolium]
MFASRLRAGVSGMEKLLEAYFFRDWYRQDWFILVYVRIMASLVASQISCPLQGCEGRSRGNDQALYQAGIWLYGICFCIHTFSKNCKHADGVVVLAPSFDEVAIYDIHVPPKPGLSVVDCTIVGTLRTDKAIIDGDNSQVPSLGVESICFDIILFSRVFSKKLRMVKFIPPRAQRRSEERERCQFEYISCAILRWRDPVERLGLVSDRLADLTPSFSGVKKSDKHDEANVIQCKRKLGDGHFTAAIMVITSSGVAPSTPETLHKLEAKHPYAPPLNLSSSPLGVDALCVHKDLVLNMIRSFPKGTSCGQDGLRAQHLMDILGGAASAVADDLLGSTTRVVNLFLSGKCPSKLREYIVSAPLTPLVKPGGGIRPIVVRTVWRRLVSKVASSFIGISMNTYLQDFQFGVGFPGGCEDVLHSVNRLVESKGNEVGLSMLLVDFSNAFNLVDRSVLLEESRVRCPSIAPWVEFAMLDLLGFIMTINQLCELTLHAWYLDDDTIVGDTLMVAKALDIIKTKGLARGLFLNVDKTGIFWHVKDPRSRVKVQFDQAFRDSLEKVVTTLGPGLVIGSQDTERLVDSHCFSFQRALDVFNTTCNVDVLSVTTYTSAPQMMKTLAKCYFGVIEKDLVSNEVGVNFRHNLVRDILVDICFKVGIMVRKEAPMDTTTSMTSVVFASDQHPDYGMNIKRPKSKKNLDSGEDLKNTLTPIIGQKPHNPLNRHKVYAVPRQRKDGWMEVKVGQLQTPSSTDTVRLALDLCSPAWDKLYGLLIESIELRPIV